MDQDYLVGIVGVIGAWDEHNGAQQYQGPESGEFFFNRGMKEGYNQTWSRSVWRTCRYAR